MDVVIVGGGMAAGNAAVTLREEGHDGRLVVLGDEPDVPFGRPPLSKTYLRGREDLSGWLVRPAEWYAANDVELRTGDPAVRVATARRAVATASGDELPYDRLLIATGGRSRALRVPGADLDGIHLLRTRADADRIRRAAGPGGHVVVVGMGFIGAEVAASLRQLGTAVTALGRGSGPLAGVLGAEVAGVMAGIHREHGVDVLPGEEVRAFEGTGRVEAVLTTSGRRLPCTAVVVGAGIEPNVEFLRGSGVALENGVLVDDRCRTNVPGVFACGDVANQQHPLFGRVRVEHYNNAEKHGRAAGLSMLDRGGSFDYDFSFWSDQYEHKLEYLGLAPSWDRFVVRGSLERRAFLGFYLRDDVVRAVVGLGRGGDPELEPDSELAACDPLIRRRLRVDPAWLADERADLRRLAAVG